MEMTANGLAALAAALRVAVVDHTAANHERACLFFPECVADITDRIIGERGVFLPDGAKVRRNAIMVEQDAEIARQAATIATLRAQYAAQLNLTIEANSTIATLRAALEAWKRVAKKYRFLYRLYLREQSDWRTALRLAGISAMGDLNPDAIRLTITVPREKRINEMVEERIAARATAKEAG